ncbi:kinesin-like protein KIF18A [Oppia nitens]|uniref:kinesin-like protein KIF18A n=1 Tax=Oppia nitens TaxID=1686743 RepID=UPI0023D9C08E|nr:kinesin-like protein KIF18A [Oppia nitens]
MSSSMKRSSHETYESSPAKQRCTATGGHTSADTSNRMRVYVRVRPLNDAETDNGLKKSIDVIDTQLLVFDPIELDNSLNTEDQYEYRGKTYRAIGRRPNRNLQFVFDRVFDENIDNIKVFEQTTKHFVDSLLNGYNCAVFAYGATGSGKTHTMLGSADDPGVIFFTTMELFRKLEEKSDEEKLELSISYFEIYNEVVFDLLDPTSGKALAVREDNRRGIVVSGLSIHQPKDANHLLEMLEYGNRNRTQHPTDANAESSRSHAVFQISLKKQEYSSSQEMSIQVSKMSLIDLAGSERATTAYKTNRSKGLQREGGNINKSLLALGNCITALAATDPRKKQTYIPYRGSKLTLLLRDSLGGNCQTTMIATVSPSRCHFEETHNTLVYADRAKGIQLSLKKNNISVGLQPRNYNNIMETQNRKITDLTEQLDQLRSECERLRSTINSVPRDVINAKNDSNKLLNSVKNSLDLLFEERFELRQKLMESESNLKKIDLRLLFRKYDMERYKTMANDDYEMSSMAKSDPLQSLYNQKLHYSDQKCTLEAKVEENESKIRKIESELLEKTGSDDWLINRFFTDENIKAEFKDKAFAEKHSLEIAKEIFSRLDTNEELMMDSVKLNRKAYQCLDGMGRLSEELETAFISLLRRVEGKKNVVWKDDISSPTISKRKEVASLFSLPTYLALNNTPQLNTSRALVSVHHITPNNANMTPERGLPLMQKNVNLPKLSLTSTVTKTSKVAVVSASKRNIDDENNALNDTFTIGAGRSSPKTQNTIRDNNDYRMKSPINNYRNGNKNFYQYRDENKSSGRSPYSSRSPYQQNNNRYNNQWNRNPNYNSYGNNGYNGSGRKYNNNRQNESKSPYYPRFRF